MFPLLTLEERSKIPMLSLTKILTCKMNGLRILSERSLNDRVGQVGPATIGRSLRSLGPKSTTYSLF